jgi:hypothetical protein
MYWLAFPPDGELPGIKKAVAIMMVLLSCASTKTSPKIKIYWEHCTFIFPIILALASRLYDGGAS